MDRRKQHALGFASFLLTLAVNAAPMGVPPFLRPGTPGAVPPGAEAKVSRADHSGLRQQTPAGASSQDLEFRRGGRGWIACEGPEGGERGVAMIASDGATLVVVEGTADFGARVQQAREVVDLGSKFDKQGERVGERAVVVYATNEDALPNLEWLEERRYAVLWTSGAQVRAIYGPTLRHVLAPEQHGIRWPLW